MPKRRPVTCGLCFRTIPYTDAIHSTTGKHYCIDGKKCERAQARRKQQARTRGIEVD